MHNFYYSIPLHFRHQSIPTSVSCGRNDINDSTLTMKVASICYCVGHVACSWEAFWLECLTVTGSGVGHGIGSGIGHGVSGGYKTTVNDQK
jgi:hypothetical protein